MSVPPPQTAPPAPSGRVSEGFQWWAPFVALVFALGVTLVLTAIVAGATGHLDAADPPPGLLLAGTFIQDIALIGATLGFAAAAGARLTPSLFGVQRFDRRRAIAPAILAFVVFYVVLIAASQLQPEAKDDLLDDLGAKTSTIAAVLTGVLVCVMAPVAEELFFRGYLFAALRRSMGWVPAAMLSGVVFGAIHAFGTPAIFLVPLAAFGFVLCWLYRRTGSLLPGMGVHAFNNALTLSVGLSLTVGQAIVVIIAAPILVIALVWGVAD